MNQEKDYSAASGYAMLLVNLMLIGFGVAGIVFLGNPWFIFMILLGGFFSIGFVIINPNESAVFVLFGAYKGTTKKNGFFWVNPFFTKRKISLRARNFDSEPIKVNDKNGNPIKIGVVLVWKVENTYKAAFEVDEYEHFVVVQSEAALRKLAGVYAYDNFDDDEVFTLRSGVEEVNHELEREI